jgi:hypothetical protein
MFHGVDGQHVKDLVRFMGRHGYAAIWDGVMYFGGRRLGMHGGSGQPIICQGLEIGLFQQTLSYGTSNL